MAALLLAGPLQAWHTVIKGKFAVHEGQTATIHLPNDLTAYHQIPVDIMNGQLRQLRRSCHVGDII